MKSVHQSLSEKAAEADLLFQLIGGVSNQKNSINKVAILKSTFVLLLYNTIEATVSMVFEEIHDKLSVEHYSDLAPKLQEIWVQYHFYNKIKPTLIKKCMDDTFAKTLGFPTFAEFTTRIKLFSGNLDSRKIDELLKKYGIGVLKTKDRGKLVSVKDIRNKLAHGESTFKEACRNMTAEELNQLRKVVFSVLISILNQADEFLNEKKYKCISQLSKFQPVMEF